MPFALAASDALRGKCGLFGQADGLGILEAAGMLRLGVHRIVAAEGTGDVDTLRAGHAIAASRAAHSLLFLDDAADQVDQGMVRFREVAGMGLGGGGNVFPYHLERIHSRKNDRHLRLVVEPAESPFGRRPSPEVVGDGFPGAFRQHIHEFAAAQGLHDDDGDTAGRGGPEARDSGLGMLVLVIILDLAEIPVVVCQDLQELVGIAVIGEADVADGACAFLFGDPRLDAEDLELFPLRIIGQLVHQIIVNAVGAQALELLLEVAVERGCALDQVLRQFGRDVHFVAETVPLQDQAERCFAARVDICGIVVVHAGLISGQDLFLRLFHVDAAVLAREAHAAVAEDGKFFSVSVFSVLHGVKGKNY